MSDRDVFQEGDIFSVEFEELQEAIAGAHGPELLAIVKQLHGLVFGYNTSTEAEHHTLRRKTDALIRRASGR